MLSETTKHFSQAESIIAYSGYIFAGARRNEESL
jgi:hypothetical protein